MSADTQGTLLFFGLLSLFSIPISASPLPSWLSRYLLGSVPEKFQDRFYTRPNVNKPFHGLMQAAVSLCIALTKLGTYVYPQHRSTEIKPHVWPVSSAQINRDQVSHMICILSADQQRSCLAHDLYHQLRTTKIKPHVWPVSSTQINRGQALHVQFLCLTISWAPEITCPINPAYFITVLCLLLFYIVQHKLLHSWTMAFCLLYKPILVKYLTETGDFLVLPRCFRKGIVYYK